MRPDRDDHDGDREAVRERDVGRVRAKAAAAGADEDQREGADELSDAAPEIVTARARPRG